MDQILALSLPVVHLRAARERGNSCTQNYIAVLWQLPLSTIPMYSDSLGASSNNVDRQWKRYSRRPQPVDPLLTLKSCDLKRLIINKSIEKMNPTRNERMIVRTKIWPKSLSDFGSMTFILVIVPLIYWFELWIVLPDLYEFGTISYYCHFFMGNYMMLNIVGNFTFTVLCDTSTRREIMPVSTAKNRDDWRLCSSCEALSPPRSWHCPTCDTCILKRDHHCIFTGCCVGHHNHRYFMMFVFYLFAATAYAFVFNNFFIWSKIQFEFPMSIVKVIFPLAIFVFGFDGSIEQFYLLLYIVSVIGMLFTGVLCVYHFHLMILGVVSNERNKKDYSYNLGWKQNIREVFGEKWYLTWFIPYVESKLPHNGVVWDTLSSWQQNSVKTR